MGGAGPGGCRGSGAAPLVTELSQSSPKQGRGVDVIQAFVQVPAQSSSRAGQFSEQHLKGSEERSGGSLYIY